MGQENTARQHFRGAVRKRVVPFAFSGTSVDVGAKVITEKGDAVGDVIAVEQDRGLMRARMKFIRETLASAAPLRSADGVALDVAVPAWWPAKYLESVD
jgi:folate-binding Fe-S cluster repair protein YgfZ